MRDEDVKNKVQEAILALQEEVPALEFSIVHERSTAHRLAVHLEALFPGWNIDCEYDRDGQMKKSLIGIKECSARKVTDNILPDIIVHRRHQSGAGNNLLVIEMKKDAEADACDLKKLQLFTTDEKYQYQLGLYINIDNGAFETRWYKDGAEQA